MIKITVITINYNDAIGLKKTIESVKMQQNIDFEYIVIDGNSKDDSLAVINNNDDFIDYWQSENDKGIYNAMNIGVKKAQGTYVLFLNSGDIFNNQDALFTLGSYIDKEQKDIFYGNLNVIGNVTYVKNYPVSLSFNYFVNDTLPFPCSLVKKSVIKEVGFFDENLKIVSDWKFFMLAICKFNKSYFYVNANPIVNFALDGISSTQPELVKIERNLVLQSEFPLFMIDYENQETLKLKLSAFNALLIVRFLRKLKILKL